MATNSNNDLVATIRADLDETETELVALQRDPASDPAHRQALQDKIDDLTGVLVITADSPEENSRTHSDQGDWVTATNHQHGPGQQGNVAFMPQAYSSLHPYASSSSSGARQVPVSRYPFDATLHSGRSGHDQLHDPPKPPRPPILTEMPTSSNMRPMPGSWQFENHKGDEPQNPYEIITSPASESSFTLMPLQKKRLPDFDAESSHGYPNKSYRTTPSPYSTHNTTPTSFDSFEPESEANLPAERNAGRISSEAQPVITLSSDPIPQGPSAFVGMSDEDFTRTLQNQYGPQDQPANSDLSALALLDNSVAMLSPSRANNRYGSGYNQHTNLANSGHSGFGQRPNFYGGGMNAGSRTNGSSKAAPPPEIIDLDSDSEGSPGCQNTMKQPEIIDLDSIEWLNDLSSPSIGSSRPSTNLLNGYVGPSYNPGFDLSYGWGHDFYPNDFSATTWADNAFTNAGLDPSADRVKYESYVDRIQYVANDPTRTKDEIKSLLENIRPDEDFPPENREGTPESLVYPLMEHQQLGLSWLKNMEQSDQSGGILADDMGLGKTIQALALMVSRRSTDPKCKTNLIIAPVALMRQWEREIKIKLKAAPHNLTTLVLHGSNRHSSWEKISSYDVVLTTFGVLSSELKRHERNEIRKAANPEWNPTSKTDQLSLLGKRCMFYRIIIDEAQCIKNRNTKVSLGASLLQAKSRFCMTGTPMMNGVDELYPLLRFLRIKPWADSKYFQSQFSRPLKSQSPAARRQAMQKLQVLLKAVLLRRTKKSVIDGKPILDLPPKTVEHQIAAFSQDELELYKALESKSQLQFNKYLKAGLVGKNYSNVLTLLLRLRQACCHPHLLRDFAQEDENRISPEKARELAKQLLPDAIARLKIQIENADDHALECPICMDVTTDTIIFVPCAHGTCSECFSRLTDPSQAIAVGDADGEGEPRQGEGKCPSCRGRISPAKVIDINAFRKLFLPDTLKTDEDAVEVDDEDSDDSDDTDDSEDENTIDDADDVDERGNLKDFVIDDDEDTESRSRVSDSTTGHAPGIKSEASPATAHGTTSKSVLGKKNKISKKSKGKAKAKEPRKTMGQLKKESLTNQKAKFRYLRRLEKDWITSAKIEKTMEILDQLREKALNDRRRPEKVIIFSQFTSLLDLLELPIHRASHGYQRYDGTMSSSARSRAIESFTDDRNVNILLTSLKAGNAGLNLTAASQVIMFDPFWNPYIEDQAVDRAHRIGQNKPVQVHRLFVQDTIEDRILALQEQKRDLIESALDEGESKKIGRLGVRDMAFLFDVPLES